MVLSGGRWIDVLRVDILNVIAVSLALLAVVAGLWPARGRARRGRGAARRRVDAARRAAPAARRPRSTTTSTTAGCSSSRRSPSPPTRSPASPSATSGAATRGRCGSGPRPRASRSSSAASSLQPHPERYLAIGAAHRIDPRFFGGHLGVLLCLGAACRGLQAFADPARFGPVRQLGRTSLLAYWIHVNLCYGPLARPRGASTSSTARASPAPSPGWRRSSPLVLGCSVVRTRCFARVRPNELFWRAVGLPLPASLRASRGQCMTDPHRDRLLYVDWLRGIAVLCMFAAHVFAAWINPSLVMTAAYRWINVAAGYAAPLFLFLTGVGMAMAFESALARGATRDEARRAARKRGWMIFIAALVFRVQEHVLGGGPVANVLRRRHPQLHRPRR